MVGITGTSSQLPSIGCGTENQALWKCTQLEDVFFPHINVSEIFHDATCPHTASPLRLLNSYSIIYKN